MKDYAKLLSDAQRSLDAWIVINFDSGEMYVNEVASAKAKLAAIEAARKADINSPAGDLSQG